MATASSRWQTASPTFTSLASPTSPASANNRLNWSSPETKALWIRACADCHSNETVWPPYAYVAPISWLVSRNVIEGRRELNLSQLLRGQPARVANEISEKITSGEMPPRDFILLHPEAVLSAVEKRTLIDGLRATLGGR